MKATAFWLMMAGGSVGIGYVMALMMELLRVNSVSDDG